MHRLLMIVAVVLICGIADAAPRLKTPDPTLPLGTWRVEFANGVVERCEIGPDGAASVVEPLRSSPGKWTLRDKSVVIASDDNRTERWTQVDGKWVVEHWCPSSEFPHGHAVVGSAARVR
ncbi:MAG TPA: hypothetical protein VKD71_05655 [Gemmataceae bacterium]|nr:hypothetical protein [Gemmataceae bacterium]